MVKTNKKTLLTEIEYAGYNLFLIIRHKFASKMNSESNLRIIHNKDFCVFVIKQFIVLIFML